MKIEYVALILSICSMLFTVVTAVFAVLSYAKVVGMEKSTHQIQYVPLDSEIKSTEELDKEMRKAFGYLDEEYDSVI